VLQNNPVALADAIEGLLRDPNRRREMGQAAAENVRRRLDVRVCEKPFHDRVMAIIRPEPPGKILGRPHRGFK
jgi:glycosyltransferase involved in cell wall biosynthesis